MHKLFSGISTLFSLDFLSAKKHYALETANLYKCD